jgi:hypothetical protein
VLVSWVFITSLMWLMDGYYREKLF